MFVFVITLLTYDSASNLDDTAVFTTHFHKCILDVSTVYVLLTRVDNSLTQMLNSKSKFTHLNSLSKK